MSSKKARILHCFLLKDSSLVLASRPRAQVQFSNMSLSAGKTQPCCLTLVPTLKLFLFILVSLLHVVLVVVGRSVEVTLCVSVILVHYRSYVRRLGRGSLYFKYAGQSAKGLR